MKKIIFALLTLAVIFTVAGCSSVITAPVEATNNPIGSKVGEQSETVNFVLFLPLNYSIDASAYKAAQNAGITKIATIDVQEKWEYRFSRFFPLFRNRTITTIVTGE